MPVKTTREMSARERTQNSLSAKTFNAVLLLATVISLAAIAFGFSLYSMSINREYRMEAWYLAKTAELYTREDGLIETVTPLVEAYDTCKAQGLTEEDAKYYETFQHAVDDNFEPLQEKLHGLQVENNASALYVALVDEERSCLIYLLDCEKNDKYCQPGTYEAIPEGEMDAYLGRHELTLLDRAMGEEMVIPAIITNTEKYGYLCSASDPIGEIGGYQVFMFSDFDMNHVTGAGTMFLRQYILFMVLISAVVALTLVRRLRRSVVTPINALAEAAVKYGEDRRKGVRDLGHFDNLGIRTGDEIEELAWSMADMENDLYNFADRLTIVTAEKERINTELNLASQIQNSMIPNIFPAFPERKEFEIFASMHTAKEVGGDFYDFFLIDDDHLCMVMADVSGKGVPAALFMMSSKILIDNTANVLKVSPAEILTEVNDRIASGNQAEMFVTVWLGILEISTGKLIAANAGHEYPAIRRADGSFALLKDKHGFVIGGMEGMKYTDYELQLAPGDAIFQYTDGVTEAMNSDNELFGTDRMLAALNKAPDRHPYDLATQIATDINGFMKSAPQFDDITMLCMRYLGPNGEAGEKDMAEHKQGKEIRVPAKKDRLAEVMAFVEGELESSDCPMKDQMQVAVAVEEIFVNIASYAYPNKEGEATIHLERSAIGKSISVTFTDSGIPYNPLEKEDPDVTLSAEERKIGGLGIYMVKQSMDDMRYQYRDGHNILTITKEW